MKNQVKKEGNYELFSTTNKNTILSLDKSLWFAITKGQRGEIIVRSNSDHEKSKTLQKGKYYLVNFKDDPDFQDMPHLMLKKGSHYEEWILPNDLPSKKDKKVKVIRTDDKVTESKLKKHLKNKDDSGKEEGLESKSKNELYEMAKKKDISGRSKMSKDQLVKELRK